MQPPSLIAALALRRLLRPRLDETQKTLLSQRAVEVAEPDLRVRLALSARGLRRARGADTPVFTNRALAMQGETEYGLVLKNALDT